MKYNEEADRFLENFYKQNQSVTAEQKFHAIRKEFDYAIENMSFSHNPTWEQKQGMMEYELLEQKGLIEMILA
jgi:hypothetical protein